MATVVRTHQIVRIRHGELGDQWLWVCECGETGFYVRAAPGMPPAECGDAAFRSHYRRAREAELAATILSCLPISLGTATYRGSLADTIATAILAQPGTDGSTQ